jgi:hypothetical protein
LTVVVLYATVLHVVFGNSTVMPCSNPIGVLLNVITEIGVVSSVFEYPMFTLSLAVISVSEFIGWVLFLTVASINLTAVDPEFIFSVKIRLFGSLSEILNLVPG